MYLHGTDFKWLCFLSILWNLLVPMTILMGNIWPFQYHISCLISTMTLIGTMNLDNVFVDHVVLRDVLFLDE